MIKKQEKIHAQLMEGHWKFLIILKVKILEAMYEATLEFCGWGGRGRGGVKQETLHCQGVVYGYFLKFMI